MTHIAWHHDEILERFRDWLARTAEDIADLEDADGPEAITVGLWADDPEPRPPQPAAWPDVGLLQVVEALTAMRHELKLQTKSGRSLEEAVQAARQGLDMAMRQFQSVQAREEESALRAALPLVESMAGLDESLARGMKALEVTHRQLTEAAPAELRQTLDDEFRRLPWWRRWWMRKWHTRMQQYVASAMGRVTNEDFTRLMEGYQLIQSRIQQELQKQGLSRVATVGRCVDPTCMTVVEVVEDPDAPPETVLAELRPGYVWHQTVIRFAEVRAVKIRSSASLTDQEETSPAGGDDACGGQLKSYSV